MKIEFKNGSVVEGIPSAENSIRSKRGEEYLKYFRENPYTYISMINQNLKWYQKLLLKFHCKLYEIKNRRV